jgi:hypothetical protein
MDAKTEDNWVESKDTRHGKTEDNWVESKDTRHGVSSLSGDVRLKCDFSFKVAKDVPREEYLKSLQFLFSSMVEQVDTAFGEVWTHKDVTWIGQINTV